MERWPRLFGAGAEGSRGLLAAIASSMITVAGVTFSITIVALALASSQYTSRILRNFMRDRTNQTVLGVFVGVFAYCLVVLRTIRGGDEGAFVPALAVLGALLLAFVAIGFLIFFIHHIAASIQATSIIAAVAGETFEAVDRLFPTEVGDAASNALRLDRDSDLSRQRLGHHPGQNDRLHSGYRRRRPVRRRARAGCDRADGAGHRRIRHRGLSPGGGGRQAAGRRRASEAPRGLQHRHASHGASGRGLRHPADRRRRSQGAVARHQRHDHRDQLHRLPGSHPRAARALASTRRIAPTEGRCASIDARADVSGSAGRSLRSDSPERRRQRRRARYACCSPGDPCRTHGG